MQPLGQRPESREQDDAADEGKREPRHREHRAHDEAGIAHGVLDVDDVLRGRTLLAFRRFVHGVASCPCAGFSGMWPGAFGSSEPGFAAVPIGSPGAGVTGPISPRRMRTCPKKWSA